MFVQKFCDTKCSAWESGFQLVFNNHGNHDCVKFTIWVCLWDHLELCDCVKMQVLVCLRDLKLFVCSESFHITPCQTWIVMMSLGFSVQKNTMFVLQCAGSGFWSTSGSFSTMLLVQFASAEKGWFQVHLPFCWISSKLKWGRITFPIPYNPAP